MYYTKNINIILRYLESKSDYSHCWQPWLHPLVYSCSLPSWGDVRIIHKDSACWSLYLIIYINHYHGVCTASASCHFRIVFVPQMTVSNSWVMLYWRSLHICHQDIDTNLSLDDVASNANSRCSFDHPLLSESEVARINGFGDAREGDWCISCECQQ